MTQLKVKKNEVDVYYDDFARIAGFSQFVQSLALARNVTINFNNLITCACKHFCKVYLFQFQEKEGD